MKSAIAGVLPFLLLLMPTLPPLTLRLINLAEVLREEASVRLGGGGEALPDPPGEPGAW